VISAKRPLLAGGGNQMPMLQHSHMLACIWTQTRTQLSSACLYTSSCDWHLQHQVLNFVTALAGVYLLNCVKAQEGSCAFTGAWLERPC
jgi:hypothetical protein